MKTFFLILGLLFVASNATLAADDCAETAVLKKHVGHYAEKSFWDRLPKAKVWASAGMAPISAIDVDDAGVARAVFAWHEGDTACVQLRGNDLWVKDSSSKKIKWLGPYIKVSPKAGDETPYLTRIFGQRCYTSNRNDQWCFEPGILKLAGKSLKAKVHQDTSESPTYGTPLIVHGERAYWVFMPFEDGWKVFKDIGDPENPINPKTDRPWRVLKP